MKNPLNKRIIREFRQDFGKHFAIFCFLVILVCVGTGIQIVGKSLLIDYKADYTRKNLEDGHFSFNRELPDKVIENLENKADVTIYPMHYIEEDIKGTQKTIRVYKIRDKVNFTEVMEGEYPAKEDEIAIDRVFAQNNKLEIGDTIILHDKIMKITGYVALPDYGCLYEKNTDVMFDAINFCVAVVNSEGFDYLDSRHITYNYAWTYPVDIEYGDNYTANKYSEDFMEVFKGIINEYNEEVVCNATSMEEIEEKIIEPQSYLPRFTNLAINFHVDDMISDSAFCLVFVYMMILLIGFVFAITISNTIITEAGVIGTLRASGYTKGELIRHYMVLPIIVSILGLMVGNILGYTLVTEYMKNLMYSSYSLAGYHTHFDVRIFVLTTIVPFVLMVIINLLVLTHKMKLSPLKFIRHDLAKKTKKKAFRLNTMIRFITRFRLRVLFQNIPSYIVLFVGMFFGGVIIVFGLMMKPMLDDFSDNALKDRICDYQYILLNEVESYDTAAEKYCLSSLQTTLDKYKTDDINIFGIIPESRYVGFADIKNGKVVISSAIADKYKLGIGDSLNLVNELTKQEYDFTIDDICEYNTGLAIFVSQEYFNKIFEKDNSYFNGYFSNKILEDLNDSDIAKTITTSDITKTSDQLINSIGEVMSLIKYFGVIVFILIMYLLTKQIIEKNQSSISMTKILGFTNLEIAGVYLAATAFVVLMSLLVAIPVIEMSINLIFTDFIYTMIAGYFKCSIAPICYVEMFIVGIVSFLIVAAMQLIKISRVPKSDALKNME